MKDGAKAFVIHQKKILLVLRDDIPTIEWPGYWNMPGGGIEEGETSEEAVLRELEEEICVRPRRYRHIGTFLYHDGTRGHRYLVELDDDEAAALKLGNEGQEMRFFTVDELDDLKLIPRSKTYLQKIKKHLREIVEQGIEPDRIQLDLQP